MFREVRRKNRILDDENRIGELLTDSEYGFLSVGITDDGYAYGVPISYAYDPGSKSLYFHCAPEGEKLDIIRKSNKVSFCVVGITEPVPNQFTTLYESVIAFGRVETDLTDEEKRKALRLLVRKYSHGFEQLGEAYMEKSWDRTNTFKVVIEHLTAKAKY